ncbi:MAG TPA: SRPBCC domain-containing protein [Kofleriaceae bacterium]
MKTMNIDLNRTIRATPEQVFEVWLDPKSPGGPWHGSERAIVNAVVDGLFYHSVQHAGRTWAHYGRFLTLDRGKKIEHTWMSEATKGIETVVTLTLTPKDGGTEVKLTHTNVPDDELGRSHQDGWTYILKAVAERLEK